MDLVHSKTFLITELMNSGRMLGSNCRIFRFPGSPLILGSSMFPGSPLRKQWCALRSQEVHQNPISDNCTTGYRGEPIPTGEACLGRLRGGGGEPLVGFYCMLFVSSTGTIRRKPDCEPNDVNTEIQLLHLNGRGGLTKSVCL